MTPRSLLLAALLVVGCDGPQQRYHPNECAQSCVHSALYDLSSIDHETPHPDVVRDLIAFCERTSDPCCVQMCKDPDHADRP